MECVQCRGESPEEVLRKAIKDVNTFGWHVMIVLSDGRVPAWAYSIGLYRTFGHPEIVLFGMPDEMMHRVINDVGREVRSGRPVAVDVDRTDLFENARCIFRTVHRKWYPDVLARAVWFYGGDGFPAVQLFWPDERQHYPWEREFNRRFWRAQPLLFRAGAISARAYGFVHAYGDDDGAER